MAGLVKKKEKGKSAEAYRKLRRLIELGELGVAERLTEPRACQLTGLTRGPVREALLRLEGDGLLSSRGYSRSRVVQYLEDQSREDLLRRYELRECIEVEVVRLAARNMTGSQVCELREIARREAEARKAGDRPRMYKAHHDFFEHLVGNCGNELIATIWRSHRLQPPQPRSAALETKVSAMSADQRRRWSAAALADAIHAHDADRAERIVREKVAHVVKALQTIEWKDATDTEG